MSILLPHSDDEVFILPFLQQLIKQGFILKVFFITTSANQAHAIIREKESENTLSTIVAGTEIVNFGRIYNILDGNLPNLHQKVLDLLLADKNIILSEGIITPILEGGHFDHDEVFKIGNLISIAQKKNHFCFSLYNAYKTPFVRVSTIFQGPVRGNLETIKFSFCEGLNYLAKCLNYKSQFVILTFLLPGLISTFLIKRKIQILHVTSFDSQSPHPGNLFYENSFKKRIKQLLGVN
jgi:hypothetical protein